MWTSFKDWLNKPFDADMDALHWFLFFGLIIIISIAWGMILRELSEVAE